MRSCRAEEKHLITEGVPTILYVADIQGDAMRLFPCLTRHATFSPSSPTSHDVLHEPPPPPHHASRFITTVALQPNAQNIRTRYRHTHMSYIKEANPVTSALHQHSRNKNKSGDPSIFAWVDPPTSLPTTIDGASGSPTPPLSPPRLPTSSNR